jgi:hypothetical protein
MRKMRRVFFGTGIHRARKDQSRQERAISGTVCRRFMHRGWSGMRGFRAMRMHVWPTRNHGYLGNPSSNTTILLGKGHEEQIERSNNINT